MDWLTENLGWLAVAALGLVAVYFVTQAGEKRKRRAEAEVILQAMIALTHSFEEIVAETVGSHFSRQDRAKIAAGMVAVVMAERVSLEQLARDKNLFAAVLAKSIQFLASEHKIARPQ